MVETGISTHAFAYNILEAGILSYISTSGFDAVELYMHKPHFNFDDEEIVNEIADSLKENDLKVNSIHCPFYRQIAEAKDGKWLNICSSNKIIRSETLDWVKRSISLAEKIPFEYAVLHFGDINDREFSDEKFKIGADALKELTKYAAGYGVRIVLENIPNAIATCAKLAEFLEDYGPDVDICFDTGHAAMAGELETGLQLLGGRIKTVHLHDTLELKDEHLPPGEGILNWKEILYNLRDNGYDGRLVLENKWGETVESTVADAAHSAIILKDIWEEL